MKNNTLLIGLKIIGLCVTTVLLIANNSTHPASSHKKVISKQEINTLWQAWNNESLSFREKNSPANRLILEKISDLRITTKGSRVPVAFSFLLHNKGLTLDYFDGRSMFMVRPPVNNNNTYDRAMGKQVELLYRSIANKIILCSKKSHLISEIVLASGCLQAIKCIPPTFFPLLHAINLYNGKVNIKFDHTSVTIPQDYTEWQQLKDSNKNLFYYLSNFRTLLCKKIQSCDLGYEHLENEIMFCLVKEISISHILMLLHVTRKTNAATLHQRISECIDTHINKMTPGQRDKVFLAACQLTNLTLIHSYLTYRINKILELSDQSEQHAAMVQLSDDLSKAYTLTYRDQTRTRTPMHLILRNADGSKKKGIELAPRTSTIRALLLLRTAGASTNIPDGYNWTVDRLIKRSFPYLAGQEYTPNGVAFGWIGEKAAQTRCGDPYTIACNRLRNMCTLCCFALDIQPKSPVTTTMLDDIKNKPIKELLESIPTNSNFKQRVLSDLDSFLLSTTDPA